MVPEVFLSIKVETLEGRAYLANSNGLAEFLAQVSTVAEPFEIVQDVAHKIVDLYLVHGDPLPDVLRVVIPAGPSLEAKIPVRILTDSIA